MNIAQHSPSTDASQPAEAWPKPPVTREQMRQGVVDLLWATAHIQDRIFGRDQFVDTSAAGSGFNMFHWMAGRQVEGFGFGGIPDLDNPASVHGVHWSDAANTRLARSMEELYDFAYFATFDPRFYPGELGDETGAWWVAMFLKEAVVAQSLFFQSEYSGGNELAAAKFLLQIAETANARHVLEGATETFVQESGVDYLTIQQMALLSDFKEDSLRVLANPKRKNPLPTQSISGATVVAVADARLWLQSKGRYTPISPKQASTRCLDLKTMQFQSPDGLCAALSDLVGAHATRGVAANDVLAAIKAIYPEALWQSAGVNGQMPTAGLALGDEDLQDEPRLRQLAQVLELDADLLVLKAKEAALRQSLRALETQIRAKSDGI